MRSQERPGAPSRRDPSRPSPSFSEPCDPHPARRLRDACEPLAMHAVGSPAVREALSGLGLDRFTGYVYGRAVALGEPDPDEVVAAFHHFEPATVRAAYLRGRETCTAPLLIAIRERQTAVSLHNVLGAAAVEGVAHALHEAVRSAPGAGRPLFTGLLRLPQPADPYGQLWRACELVREHRGGTHGQACRRRGLDGVESNVLTELWLGFHLGEHTRTRGWNDRVIAAAAHRLARRGLVDQTCLTAAGQELRHQIEAETNLGEESIVRRLGDRLETIIASLTEWSSRCIAAGTFTSDPRKRAAG